MSDGVIPKAEVEADPFFYGWRLVRKEKADGSVDFDQQPLTSEDVLHPQEGDHIMIHTAHDRDVHYLRGVLQDQAEALPGGRVLSDVRIDWEVPGLGAHGPDVILFTGARPEEHPVGTFKVKEHGATPLVVVEVSSPSTRVHDLNTKVQHYHRAGVRFYAVVDYDPDANLARAEVLGYRATPQGFVRVPTDDRGRVWVEPLGIWLAWDGRAICYDGEGRPISDRAGLRRERQEAESRSEEMARLAEEAILARREAEQRLAQAEQQAADLAALVAQLQAQLGRKGEPG